MALASEIAAIAVSAIAEFGVSVTLTRAGSGGTYDAAQGKVTGGAPASQTFMCLTEPKGLYLGPNLGVIGDKKLTLAADGLAFAPEPGDTFAHGGKTYTIMKQGVKATEVQGVVVLYELYGTVGS